MSDFPSSSVASPIFAAIWSLVSLGAMRAGTKPLLPFRPVWMRYVQDLLPTLIGVRDLLQEQCHFDSSVADMLLDDWRLRDARNEERDQTDLDLIVALALGRLGGPLPATDTQRREWIDSATRKQFAALLDALLVAERAAELVQMPFGHGATRDILWAARGLAGSPHVFADETKDELLAHLIAEWRLSNGVNESRPEDLSHWIRARLDQLVRATGDY